MQTLIVMNNATEQMLGRHLSENEMRFAAKSSLRNAWLAGPGDMILSRTPLTQMFKSYITEVMGLGSAFEVLCLEDPSSRNFTLSDDLLLADWVVEYLKARIDDPKKWRLMPCYQSEGTARLQQLLCMPDTPGRAFAEQRGTDLLNRKSHFRQLAGGIGLPIADGSIVSTESGLAVAVSRHIDATGKVIVKRDNGAGCTGNFVITKGDVEPHFGACETFSFQCGAATVAARLWPMLTIKGEGVVSVEVYLPAKHSFYVEYLIEDDGRVDFLSSGTIKMRIDESPDAKQMHWSGLELPADADEGALTACIAHAERFSELAANIGYRGYINIDAILTDSGDLIFNEANGRWGGGTVLDHVARSLLGDNFTQSTVVASFRDVPAKPFDETLSILRYNGLHYNSDTREGAIVLAYDDSPVYAIEGLLIARSRQRVRALEIKLLELLR